MPIGQRGGGAELDAGLASHPLMAFLDATGEPLAASCVRATPPRATRPMTTSCVLDDALAQLPVDPNVAPR